MGTFYGYFRLLTPQVIEYTRQFLAPRDLTAAVVNFPADVPNPERQCQYSDNSRYRLENRL